MTNVVNPFMFAGVIELAHDTTCYKELANLTNYTSDARAIGAASATREVYALIVSYNINVGRTLTSVTIGGVSADIHAQTTSGADGNSVVVAIASANVPTGTTATVEAFFSGQMNTFACAVIAIDSLISRTPVDTATNVTDETTTVNTGAVFEMPGGGYAMAVVGTGENSVAPSFSWDTLTENAEDFVDGPDDIGITVASALVGSSFGTNIDITVTVAGATGAGKAIVALSVR